MSVKNWARMKVSSCLPPHCSGRSLCLPFIHPDGHRKEFCLPGWAFARKPNCIICSASPPRHNTYLQECTGQREPTYQLNIHDIKLLFLRFAMEQSFSADTGGGGRESNIHLIPYIIHTVLYVLNTSVSRRPRVALSSPTPSPFFPMPT